MIKRVLSDLKKVPYMEIALCTDDVEPDGIISEGMMDNVLREVIANGIPPAFAYRWATLNGARHYHLKDQGGIAPGYLADILLLTSLEEVKVCDVFANGKQVVQNGRLTAEIKEPPVSIDPQHHAFHSRPTRETFMIKRPSQAARLDVNTIEMQEANLTVLRRVSVAVENHYLTLKGLPDDFCYLTVVPRHGQPHPAQTVLLSGFAYAARPPGRHRGARFAQPVDRRSYPDDMLLAALELEKCGGGILFADGGKVLGKLELPVAGLMSPKSVAELAEENAVMNRIGRDWGIQDESPILSIAGLALLVIPEVRISDTLGLFDTIHQKEIPLFPEA
jgi:adenine deaminase